MGKVLTDFNNGWPGAVSRSIDEIVIALKNAADVDIPFGAPVFKSGAALACIPFDTATPTNTPADNFVGFAVRAADKTPDTVDGSAGTYHPSEPMDVLVRGSIVAALESNASPGQQVYIRKSDGKLTTQAGTEGSTILLTGVTIRQYRDSLRRAELAVKTRHAL